MKIRSVGGFDLVRAAKPNTVAADTPTSMFPGNPDLRIGGVHARQRSRPETHSLGNTTEEPAGFAAHHAPGKEAADVATRIELPDRHELFVNAACRKCLLHHLDH